MTDISVSQGASPGDVTGRSLTELAIMRFKRNKAAMAGKSTGRRLSGSCLLANPHSG